MHDTEPFAWLLLAVAAAGLALVSASRLTDRIKVPLPALVLVASALAVRYIPSLHAPSQHLVTRVVTVALIAVLFDGGMHIGWGRFRSALGPIAAAGLAGTVLTAAAGAVAAHVGLGTSWYVSLLLATALAPTDPAVVFAVLGRRRVRGRASTILEGESGANDPVGIALMASLLAAGGLHASEVTGALGRFALQLGVGAAVGVAGGLVLLAVMRRVPLPGEGFYPLRTVGASVVVFAAATLLHGSGFLAVFAAGIAIGDERAPYKREIERFHDTLASLGEIVAFVALGLTVDLDVVTRADVWVPGLLLGAGLALVIRPVLVGLCLVPAQLGSGERRFVLFAGLKGAVPILLGGELLTAAVPGAARLYGIVVIVVAVSVVVQAGLLGPAARLLRVPMETVEPEPWSFGVRLRDDPTDVHRLTVAAGSAADGTTVAALDGLPEEAWITLLVRDGGLLAVRGDTGLRAGDTVTVLADAAAAGVLDRLFSRPPASPPRRRDEP